jgi:hypothetical protein
VFALKSILKSMALLLAFCSTLAQATEGIGPFSPFSILTTNAPCRLCIGVQMAKNEVPLFRAGERNSRSTQLAAHWAPSSGVGLRIGAERLWVTWPDQTSQSGWGDVRLGTTARIRKGLGLWPALWVDWVVKLPNAQDESELGTDETDVVLSGVMLWERGAWEGGVRGGLAIWGDPLQFANQDDAFLFTLHLSHTSPRYNLSATYDWQRVSPRNPSRAVLLGGAKLRGFPGGVWGGVEAGLGLNPAAPDWQAALRFGVDATCRLD